MGARLASNFGFLGEHDEQLVRLGMLAERYFPDDPNTSLLKLRQLGELLAQLLASRTGLYLSDEEPQYDLLRRLQDGGVLPREVAQLFGEVRRAGNAASHALTGDHRTALSVLKISWQLGLWYHRTFKDTSYKSGPFIPPRAPADESAELKAELASLKQKLDEYEASHSAEARALEATLTRLRAAQADQAFWEQMAAEAEQAKAALEAKLAAQQAVSVVQKPAAAAAVVQAAGAAAQSVELDEAETRKLIDEQLRAGRLGGRHGRALLRQGRAAREGKNLAIAEWPTASGPADYVLFVGLTPVATVEAKRKNVDVSASLQQAKRYSRDFTHVGGLRSRRAARGASITFRSPSRPTAARTCAARDQERHLVLRRAPLHQPRARARWLVHAGRSDHAAEARRSSRAHEQLKAEPFDYGFPLRPLPAGGDPGRRERHRGRAARDAARDGDRHRQDQDLHRAHLPAAQGAALPARAVPGGPLGARRAGGQRVQRHADGEPPDLRRHLRHQGTRGHRRPTPIPRSTSPPCRAWCSASCSRPRAPRRRRSTSTTASSSTSATAAICSIASSPTPSSRSAASTTTSRSTGACSSTSTRSRSASPPRRRCTRSQIFGKPIYHLQLPRGGDRRLPGRPRAADPDPHRALRAAASSGDDGRRGRGLRPAAAARIDLFTTPDEIKLEVEDFNRKVITESFNRVVCEYLAKELDPSAHGRRR